MCSSTIIQVSGLKPSPCFRRYAQLYSQNPAHYSQIMPYAQAVPCRIILAYFTYKPIAFTVHVSSYKMQINPWWLLLNMCSLIIIYLCRYRYIMHHKEDNMGSRLAVLAQPLYVGGPIHRFRGLHIARPQLYVTLKTRRSICFSIRNITISVGGWLVGCLCPNGLWFVQVAGIPLGKKPGKSPHCVVIVKRGSTIAQYRLSLIRIMSLLLTNQVT